MCGQRDTEGHRESKCRAVSRAGRWSVRQGYEEPTNAKDGLGRPAPHRKPARPPRLRRRGGAASRPNSVTRYA